MVTKDIYKLFLSYLITEFPNEIQDLDSVCAYYDFDDVESAFHFLNFKVGSKLSSLKELVTSNIADYNNLGTFEEEVDVSSYSFKLKPFPTDKPQRDIIYVSPKLYVCSLKTSANNNFFDSIWKLIEILLAKDSRESNDILNEIFNATESTNKFLVIYDALQYVNPSPYELYSYAILKYHNDLKTIKVRNELQWSASACFGLNLVTPFLFSSDIHYEQYYDFYDVINDWLLSTDLLTAFQRMYQVLEYMVYRKKLVLLIDANEKKQSFLRNIVSLSKTFEKGERDTMIKELRNVLIGMENYVTTVNSDVEAFVEKYWLASNESQSYIKVSQLHTPALNSSVSRLIYDVRCAIVHNKESELHFTLNSYDDFKILVPLMNEVIKGVGIWIFSFLQNRNNGLSFTSPSFNLY